MIEEKIYNLGDKNKKICLLTDIHYDLKYDLTIFDKIIESIKINKPDYICIVGDTIDNAAIINQDLTPLINFIKKLASISQVIITRGNHETKKEKYNTLDWFLNLNRIENVYFLNNKNLIRGDICFIDINLSNNYFKKEKVNVFIKEFNEKTNIKPIYYNVLLCHSPYNVLREQTIISCPNISKVNLILSGHMHNGLVPKWLDKKSNIGLIGPTFTIFPKFARGIVTKNIKGKKINLVISGGITKLSSSSKLSFLNKLYPISIVYINI